jgi:hypothetical protein
MRSDAMKVEMELHPPPPMPASALPRIIIALDLANPQDRLPTPNSIKQKRKPERRPKTSVSFPLNGCVVVRAMRYAEPSHDMMANEWNSDAIVEDNVEVIVLSGCGKKQGEWYGKQATYPKPPTKIQAR